MDTADFVIGLLVSVMRKYSIVMVLQEMEIYLDNCCLNRPFDDQSQMRIRIETEVLKTVNVLNKFGIQKIDSLHIACAAFSKCDYFLTTDDNILQRADQIDSIKINDPIGFIKEVMP